MAIPFENGPSAPPALRPFLFFMLRTVSNTDRQFPERDRSMIAIGGPSGGTLGLSGHSPDAAPKRSSKENFHMKRLLLIGVAACAFAALPVLSASAMPRATADTLVSDTDSPVILARGGHGHGHGHMGRGGRGHHYGWGRGHHRGRR
jgi:hypothetical protein